MSESTSELRLGVLSVGDIIALGAVVFMSGALWYRAEYLHSRQVETDARVSALEQVVPSEYVRRQEYREDLREIKGLLQRIEVKVDTKQDRR